MTVRGLLVRLSALDSDAERAVRVISFFDGLTRNGANFEILVRAAAGLAECPVGMAEADGRVVAYSDTGGKTISASDAAPDSNKRPFGLAGIWGYVWLDRAPGLDVDEMVLDRLVVAAEIILEQQAVRITGGADEASLVRTVVNSRAAGVARLRASQSLGISGRVTLVATLVPDAGNGRLAQLKHRIADELGEVVRGAAIMDDEVACVLVASSDSPPMRPLSGQHYGWNGPLGVSDSRAVIDSPTSWLGALRALKFALAQEVRCINEANLGALGLLADLSNKALLEVADVQVLVDLSSTESGQRIIDAVSALCQQGSLRKASVVLHLHHSSVTSRIHRAQEAFGFSLDDEDGLLRARVALTAWRLARVRVMTSGRSNF